MAYKFAKGEQLMQWEYKVIQIDNVEKSGLVKWMMSVYSYDTGQITAMLNTEGSQGWELIEVLAPVSNTGTASQLLLFFKRQKA